MENNDFTSTIPTAITVAYPRIFTNIPYSMEIWDYLKNTIEVAPYIPKDTLAVELEARYKLIDKLLKETGIKQILELASGYSQRGLTFAKDFNCKYIELDLEKVITFKKEMLSSITTIPNNLKIISGDATNENDFNKCKNFFNPNTNVVVVNEGLLRYLDFEEKKLVAKNVFTLLQEFGGKWITSDFTSKKFIQNQDSNVPNLNKDLSKITSRNNPNWRFEDKEQVKDFLNGIGFNNIEFHYFNEVKNDLIAPRKLNIDDKMAYQLLDGAFVTVIGID